MEYPYLSATPKTKNLPDGSTAPTDDPDERMRRVLERYQVVLANMQDILAVHRPDGSFAWVSPSITEMLGYTQEEVVGKNMHDLVHPDDYAAFVGHPLPRDGKDWRGRYRIKCKNDCWLWVETLARPIYNGKPDPIAIQTQTRDISHLVEVENELSEALWVSQQNFYQVPLATLHVALDGSIIRANHAFCDIIGCTGDEVTSFAFLDLVHPEDREKSQQATEQLLGGKSHVRMIKRLMTRSGYPVSVYDWRVLIRRSDGRPSHFVCQLQPIADLEPLIQLDGQSKGVTVE